jgi:hypothetical protein
MLKQVLENYQFLVSIGGWIFTLGMLWAISRNNARRLEILEADMKKHHDDKSIHTDADIHKEFRAEIRESLKRMEDKIDKLPCSPICPPALQRVVNQ